MYNKYVILKKDYTYQGIRYERGSLFKVAADSDSAFHYKAKHIKGINEGDMSPSVWAWDEEDWGALILPADLVEYYETWEEACKRYFVIKRNSVKAEKEEASNPELFDIVVNGKWGFMDKEGRTIIEPRFNRVGEFSEGICPVPVGLMWGFINESGEIVINPRFVGNPCLPFGFREGLLRVWDENKAGYMDKTGEIVIDYQFFKALYFQE